MKERKSILVIEDEELNMKLIRQVIKIGQYDVFEAVNAEDGLELARKKLPDLILMDIQLPGMDGLSATRIIKTDPNLKDTPVVALTGFAMEQDEKKAMEIGFDGYITKPIRVQQVLNQLADYLKTE